MQKVLSFHRADIPHLSLDCGFLNSLTAVSSKNIIYPCNTCRSGSNAISLLGFAPQRVLALGKACRTKNGTKIQVPSFFSFRDAAQIPASGNCDTHYVSQTCSYRLHSPDSVRSRRKRRRRRRKRRIWSLRSFPSL